MELEIQATHIAPFHGGRLREASEEYAIPLAQWQDLSTGISPWSWPVPSSLPSRVWRDLPDDAALLESAKQYYGYRGPLCAVAGSQVAIRLIPQLVPKSTVAIPSIGYQEHAYAWRVAGHVLHRYDSLEALYTLVQNNVVEHIVLINPNNPTAAFIAKDDVMLLRQQMDENAVLLVDEAFVEGARRPSLLRAALPDNTVVLRSIGKFFGLAGLRLGFVFGSSPIIGAIHSKTQPWAVSSVAIEVAALAFADTLWQAQQQQRIQNTVHILTTVLRAKFPEAAISEAGLFATVFDQAPLIDRAFSEAAKHGVLLRKGLPEEVEQGVNWLRVGLADDAYQRLTYAWW